MGAAKMISDVQDVGPYTPKETAQRSYTINK